MREKIKISLYLLLILISIFSLLFLLQTLLLKRVVENGFLSSGIKRNDYSSYNLVRCDLSYLNPEIVLVSDLLFENNYEYSIYFFDFQNPFSFYPNFIRTGGTNVKNINYEELVELIKEDCLQFKKSTINDNKINGPNWIYMNHQSKDLNEVSSQGKEYRKRLNLFNLLSESEKAKIEGFYGDWRTLNEDQFLNWSDKIISDIKEGMFSLES